MWLLLVLILVLNVGISYWNARVCGQYWVESKTFGGFERLVVWSGAVQSAIGFSMVYLFALAGGAYAMGWLSSSAMKATMSLWYIAIIVPALGTGLIITVHSWIVAYRQRDFASIGTSAYNTLAQAHNMYAAVEGIPQALGNVGSFFSSDGDGEDKAKGLVVAIALAALMAGVLTTYAIIQKYAGTLPLPQRDYARA